MPPTTSWGRATSALGCSTRAAAAPRSAARATKSWPSTCWPRIATKSPGLDLARVEGDAPDRHVRERGRTDRPPSAGHPGALPGQPLDQAAEGLAPRLGGPEQVGDRRFGHRRSNAATRPASRPTQVAARIEDALVRPAELEPLAAERQLVLVEAVERAALAWFPARAGDVHPSEVHLGAALADGQLDRAPAEEVERPRGARRGSPRGRPSGRSRAGRRGDRGRGRPAADRQLHRRCAPRGR